MGAVQINDEVLKNAKLKLSEVNIKLKTNIKLKEIANNLFKAWIEGKIRGEIAYER